MLRKLACNDVVRLKAPQEIHVKRHKELEFIILQRHTKSKIYVVFSGSGKVLLQTTQYRIAIVLNHGYTA